MAVLITKDIGGVIVDVCVSEDHTSDISLTKLPVEQGADITDHAYLEPKVVTITGIAGEKLDSAGNFVSPSDSYRQLLDVQKSLQPFDIQTGLLLYRNMLIKSITTKVDADNANVLEYTAELNEVLIVGTSYSDQTNAPAQGQVPGLQDATLEGDARERGAPTVQRGDNVIQDTSFSPETGTGKRNREMLVDRGYIV